MHINIVANSVVANGMVANRVGFADQLGKKGKEKHLSR